MRPLNIGRSSAWRIKAANLDAWRSVVDTATLEFATKEEKKQPLLARYDGLFAD